MIVKLMMICLFLINILKNLLKPSSSLSKTDLYCFSRNFAATTRAAVGGIRRQTLVWTTSILHSLYYSLVFLHWLRTSKEPGAPWATILRELQRWAVYKFGRPMRRSEMLCSGLSGQSPRLCLYLPLPGPGNPVSTCAQHTTHCHLKCII